jgi:hypothetical protein
MVQAWEDALMAKKVRGETEDIHVSLPIETAKRLRDMTLKWQTDRPEKGHVFSDVVRAVLLAGLGVLEK